MPPIFASISFIPTKTTDTYASTVGQGLRIPFSAGGAKSLWGPPKQAERPPPSRKMKTRKQLA